MTHHVQPNDTLTAAQRAVLPAHCRPAPLPAEESVELPGDSWAGVVAAAPYLGNLPKQALLPPPARSGRGDAEG